MRSLVFACLKSYHCAKFIEPEAPHPVPVHDPAHGPIHDPVSQAIKHSITK